MKIPVTQSQTVTQTKNKMCDMIVRLSVTTVHMYIVTKAYCKVCTSIDIRAHMPKHGYAPILCLLEILLEIFFHSSGPY